MQSSIITNVGQVVTSGQEIMRIVPEDSGLEIQAYVRNRDIGFVSVGQEAVVKIESFPFTRYGAIKAHVTRIAKDAIPEPDANAIEGDPTRVSNAAGFAGGERTQNLVFPVVLKPDAETIAVDGAVRAAHVRHGGDGRAQDRRAAHARISVLAAGRGRVEGDAGAVSAVSRQIGSGRSTPLSFPTAACGRSGIQRVSRSLGWLDSRSDLRSAGNDNAARPERSGFRLRPT